MKKNEYFQMIRGISIISVIIIHLLSYQENQSINIFNIILRTITDSCVGVFIFLSGYFINIQKLKENKKEYIKNRLKRIGIPFLIFSVLAATIELIKNNDSIWQYMFNIILGRSSVQLYYIVALAQLILITPFLVKVVQSKKKIINIIVIFITPVWLILIGFFYIKYNYQIPLRGTIFFGWILYYYIGIYCKINSKQLKIINYPNKKVLVLGIPLIICITILNVYMYKAGVNYTHITSQLKISNMIYIIYAIMLILCFVNRTRNIKYLVNLGDLSFGIYFVHTYFIKIYNHFFDINHYYVYLLIGIIFVTAFSYYSISIFKKITKGRFDKILGF